MELENLVTQSLDEYVKELQRNFQILKQFFGRKICDKILLACPWSKHDMVLVMVGTRVHVPDFMLQPYGHMVSCSIRSHQFDHIDWYFSISYWFSNCSYFESNL